MEFALVMLALNVVFNLVVWPPFLRRVKADPRARDEHGNATRFLTVHFVLIGIAFLLALVSAAAFVVALMRGA